LIIKLARTSDQSHFLYLATQLLYTLVYIVGSHM